MFEFIFVAFVCACTWLGIRTARRPRRKRKAHQFRYPLIEQVFGYPFYYWLCTKFFSDKVFDEMLITVRNEEETPVETTTRYALRRSGLWVPAR